MARLHPEEILTPIHKAHARTVSTFFKILFLYELREKRGGVAPQKKKRKKKKACGTFKVAPR
jgi:hypothetical protein